MSEKEAYEKALKIADMIGIKVISYNDDGSKWIKEPNPKDRNELDIEDIMAVIME
ncbi:hypothetical protein GCM10011409_20000 [Lentibacillus populi]|uniref:Uncharacterized protein n=1 Tax=Lentibacillus populi TaxID=1827502 RepID=A0A9W5TXS1_9BACI|nr:hypothetical protein [Lentibacillus populi]GGB42432.1 hypothetical protein GCM10011409_20000 [Lentibacillus populi]